MRATGGAILQTDPAAWHEAQAAGEPRVTSPEQRLADLGLALPALTAPAGAYLAAVRVDELVHTSGQLPFVEGQLRATGKVGTAITVEHARALAATATLNALAAVLTEVATLDEVRRVVKVVVYVASDPSFTGQSAVGNGASELLAQVFGEAGRHARSAVGVAVLPADSPVEVELVVQVSPGRR